MILYMKSTFLFLALVLSSLLCQGQASPKFSSKEVAEDLRYLHASLKEAHYDAFAYTTEEEYELAYRRAKSSIPRDSLTLLETINLFQQLVAVLNNGHTSIDFPIQPYIEYASSGGTIFPLELAFEDNRSIIRKNWSTNGDINPGDEILSIDGRSMKEILDRIGRQVSAERLYFKKAKIELYSFPRYYWQVFGEQTSFEVKIRSDGMIRTHSLQAVKAIEGYEAKRTEVIDPRMRLEFFKSAAYLNPGGFGGDEKEYQKFIDSAFAKIKANKCKNLIVDLRNNPGGDDSYSDYLVSYLADRPFRWNSSFTLKTSALLKEHVRKERDTTRLFWQEALDHKDGEIYGFEFEEYSPQKETKRFDGKVFVLINRQSHSQSAVTAAQIQDYGFGTLVGEETGDFPSLYASIFQFSLPNTGIPVSVSKGYMIRVNGSTKKEGVQPDIFIRDHLLDEEDEILNGLLSRLEEELVSSN